MPLTVTSDGKSCQFSFFCFDVEKAKVILRQVDDQRNLLSVDYPLIINESFKDKAFSIYFLSKKELNENDIFQVYEKPSKKKDWLVYSY